MSEITEDNIRALLPRDKMDEDHADAIIALGYPAVAPILPELIEWLQDYNWPVAQVLAPFLATIGTPLVPEIRRIFKTNDHAWKSWVLLLIVAKPNEVAEALREELTRFATHPTKDETWEELDIDAAKILHELDSRKAKG